MLLMLQLVQTPKCFWSGPGVFPEVLGVNLLHLRLFTVRKLDFLPSDGILIRFYLFTVLSGVRFSCLE